MRPGENGPRPAPAFRFPWRSAGQSERDFAEELAFHREMRFAELTRNGMSPDDAHATIDRETGDVDGARSAIAIADRTTHSIQQRRHVMGQLGQEVTHVVRRLRRARGFAFVATLTLALGIGASVLMFNVVAAVLLAPLPYADAGRVMMVWQFIPSLPVGDRLEPIGGRQFKEMQQSVRSFESVTGFRARALNLGAGADVERVNGIEATGDFFTTLGVRPELGRYFTRADETPQTTRAVVISDGLWRRRFGAERGVIGRVIDLNAEPFVVVAVAPPGFAFPRGAEMPASFAFPERADAWIPIAPPIGGPDDLAIAARLRRGATIGAARAELDGVRDAMLRLYPQAKGFFGMLAVPLRTQLVGQSERLLLSLLGAVALLLVISCVNAAQLQLAQLQRRRRDLAVRAALGAPSWRVMGGCVLEVSALAIVAAAVGTGLAVVGFDMVRAEFADKFPLLGNATFEFRSVGVAFAATMLVGLVAGLGPALSGASVPLIETLRRGSRGGGGGHGTERARRVLIVVEVTLAVVLVALAGLLGKSLTRQLTTDLGFTAPEGLTFEVTLPTNRYPERQGPTYMEHPAGVAFITGVLDRIRAIPGVEAAAMGKPLPLSGSQEWTVLWAEGVPPSTSASLQGADYTFASGDMFRALGTTLVAGRDFASSDRVDGPQVVIVNRAMAQWLWPGQSALDKRIKLGGPRSTAPWMTVIGVANDLRRYALTDTTRPEMIVPYTQKPYPTFSTLQFVVRSTLAPAQLMPEIQRAIAQVDPSVPASRVRTMEDLVSDASTSARFAAGFMAAFAGAALFLAMIGLYGVIAYSVLQRNQELGVRRALGASTGQIVRLVAREAGTLGALGVVAGTVIALGAGFAMRSMLYGVSAFDVPTIVGTVIVLGVSAMAACVVPAWRATRVEPKVALEEN